MSNYNASHSPLFRYQSVERRILQLIESGALRPGDRIPSLRRFSSSLGVSLSTVSQAYMELERKGVIEARPRSGYFVRRNFRSLPPVTRKPAASMDVRPVKRNLLIPRILNALRREDVLPLGVAQTHVDLLPHKALGRLLAAAMREHGQRGVGYEVVQGTPELRRQIAFRAVDWGEEVSPDGLLVTAGAMEALYISLRVLTRPGDTVLIQTPTYHCFLQLLENLGLRVLEIPSCPETGINMDDVRDAVRQFSIQACILTPNFNNPDGAIIPEEVKQDLVGFLGEHSVPLVEDDVYGDLYYGDSRPCCCKKFDDRGLVILCSSFSKTLAPGFRVGWMSPGPFLDKALEIKVTTSVCTATPMQLAISEYLRRGQYDHLLGRLRVALQDQLQACQLTVSRSFPPGTRMSRPSGGSVLWIEMEGVDAMELFYDAESRHIGIAPGSMFSSQDRYGNFVRINYGLSWTDEIRQAVETLGELAAALQH